MTTSDGSKPLDVQVGGDHYKSMAIQPMEYSMANKLDACQHTIIKYVTRFRDKGGIQDLEKAKHCIDLLIHFERQAAALSFVDEAQAFIDPADVEIASAGSFAEKLEQFVSDADDRLNTEYHRIVVEQQKALQEDMDEFLRTIPVEPASAIDDDSERMQAIGQNGNGGEHYELGKMLDVAYAAGSESYIIRCRACDRPVDKCICNLTAVPPQEVMINRKYNPLRDGISAAHCPDCSAEHCPCVAN